MPYTSTGEANEAMPWNPFSQLVGKQKVMGEEVGIPPMPAQEQQVVGIHALEHEQLQAEIMHLRKLLEQDVWYLNPAIKWVPTVLDPTVEFTVRLDGRWHVAVWLGASGNINVAFPQMQAVSLPVVAGWNVLSCPDGTKIYAASTRTPAVFRYANKGIIA